jgi:hypothetical protein
MRTIPIALLAFLALAAPARGGPADVVSAKASCSGETCAFVVTVRHADEGWKHYADAWQVLAPDGTVLATRVLRHPHVAEQPFTRGMRGVRVPAGLDRVRIRARDSVHGLGGHEVEVTLER